MKTPRQYGGSISTSGDNLTLFRGLVAFWDLSKDPADASDLEKLAGQCPKGGGLVVTEFDLSSGTHQKADGYHGKAVSSDKWFNPLAWVCRLFTKDGQGRANFWMPRGVLDLTKKNWEREHRSGISVNGCDKLAWAWDMDTEVVGRISGHEPSVSHKELEFDDAGFLPMLTGKNTGKKTRGTKLLQVSKRGGYITDGKLSASLWHIVHMIPRGGVGSTATGDGCGLFAPGMAVLRGDVEWDFGGRIAHLVVDKTKYKETKGRPVTGKVYIGEPGPCPPKKELHDISDVSNSPILNRSIHDGLRVVVFLDEWRDVPTPGGVPPDFPDKPGTTDTPTPRTTGTHASDWWGPTGNDVGAGFSTPIPEFQEGPMQVAVNFGIPSTNFSGDIDLSLDYVVVPLDGAVAPAAVTGSLATTINSTSHPYGAGHGAYQDGRVVFTIPAEDLASSGGGKVAFALYRSGVDSQADTLEVLKYAYQFGQVVPS